MAGLLGNIRKDIREKTAYMDRKQKAEYIASYYWYHILLTILGAGILLLFVRHLFFREPPKEFSCVIVNQAVDYERDEWLCQEFSSASGIPKERLSFDSDYIFSYGEHRLEGANESSYEKFFFRWGTGELDAAFVPESFYEHCLELGYEFKDVRDIRNTELASRMETGEEDPVVLVFIENPGHEEAQKAFLTFVEGERLL